MADEKNDDVQQATKPALRIGTPSTQLKLKFGTLSGDKTFTYNYADDAADVADVQALMQAMITNGAIFKYPPLVASEAWIEQKTITPYDVSSVRSSQR